MLDSRKSHFQCQLDLRDFAAGEAHFRVSGCAPSGAFDSYREESEAEAEAVRGFKCIQFNMQMSLSATSDQAQFPPEHMWRPQTQYLYRCVCVCLYLSISESVYGCAHK